MYVSPIILTLSSVIKMLFRHDRSTFLSLKPINLHFRQCCRGENDLCFPLRWYFKGELLNHNCSCLSEWTDRLTASQLNRVNGFLLPWFKKKKQIKGTALNLPVNTMQKTEFTEPLIWPRVSHDTLETGGIKIGLLASGLWGRAIFSVWRTVNISLAMYLSCHQYCRMGGTRKATNVDLGWGWE